MVPTETGEILFRLCLLQLSHKSISRPYWRIRQTLALWTCSESKDQNADKKGTPLYVLIKEVSYGLEAISWAKRRKGILGTGACVQVFSGGRRQMRIDVHF